MSTAEPRIELGHEVATGRPVTIGLRVIERHVWIQGMTGAMKTIISVKIAEQLMRLDPSAAFVFCDLGGDQYGCARIDLG